MVNKNIWLHFEKLGRVIGFQQNRVKCKYCNYELCEIATRCEAHFKKCKDVPTHVLQSFLGFGINDNNDSNSSSSSSSSSLSSSTSSPLSSSSASTSLSLSSSMYLKNQSLNYFVDKISKKEQDELEILFAKSIYQCGLFLSLSELTPIKNLWAKARPSFKLPGRKKLSTTLLDNVYEETKQEVDKLIEEAEYYSLVSDGW